MNFCPNCGNKVQNPEDTFCMNCGQKLPEIVEAAVPQADAAQPVAEDAAQQVPAMPEEAEAGPSAAEPPLVAKVAEEPVAAAKEEDKKQAAMRIAQAINGEDFAAAPQPAQNGAAAGLQDLEKLVDTDAAPAAPQADLFAAGGTTAQFGVPGAGSTPGAEAGGDLSQLADLMDAETAAVVPEESFFFEEEPATAQELARLEKVMAQERQAEPRQAAMRQQAQPARQQPQQRMQEAVPPQEAQQPKQRPVPPWVAQQQPEETRVQTAPPQQTAWQQPQQKAPQQPTIWQQAAAQPAEQPAPKQQPAKSQKQKSGAGATAVKVILVALLVVVAICATTLIMLYMANRPGKAINDFTAALQAGNVEKLASTVRTVDVLPAADTEDWMALCAGFEDDTAVAQLQNELQQQVSDPDATGLQYGAVRLKSEPLFFFIDRYYIELEGVQVLAPDAVDGTVLRLGTTEYANGEMTPSGMLYSHIMPGKYNGALLPAGEYQASSVFVIEAFAYPEYNQIGAGGTGTGQSATITVGNCTSDDAVIYVGGVPVAQTPVNGVVTIPNVPLGSVIKITLAQDGQQMEASVVFSDLAMTNLMFGEYTAVGQVSGGTTSTAESAPSMDATEIEDMMWIFYTSYLDCINAQSMDPLRLSTEANTERLEQRVVSDANKKNLFQYISVDCDEESIVTGQVDGKPTIEFNMTFTYQYWPRDGSGQVEEAFNHQSVQLVYEDGEWLVNYMVFVDDDDFADHKLADFK